MALKNLTGASRSSVYLVRVAHADVGPGSALSDDYESTATSAVGEEIRQAGLSLTTNTFSVSHIGYTQNVPSGPDPCDFFKNVNTDVFRGNGSFGHWYNFSIPAGGTQAVVMTYKPI